MADSDCFMERISQPRPSDSNMSSSTVQEDDEEVVVDVDDDVDDQEAGTSEDEVDSLVNGQGVLSSSSGRVFMVQTIQRASGGHRPSLLLDGRLCEIVAQGTGHRLQHVATSKELQLSLRYEPPSPKFARSCPDMISYRLKLLQGTQFIYLLRGLPNVLVLDHAARAVGWGVLQLVFATPQQLESFLAVLRHVSVVSDQLWPRHIAALWRPNLREAGVPACTVATPTPGTEAAQKTHTSSTNVQSEIQSGSVSTLDQPGSPSTGPDTPRRPHGWPLLVADLPGGPPTDDPSGRKAAVGTWWGATSWWEHIQGYVSEVQAYPQVAGGVVAVVLASAALIALRTRQGRATQ